MSCDHPTHGPRTVPLQIPTCQTAILRSDLLGGLSSALDDLRRPERLRDPVATACEGVAYARMLEALDRGEIDLPDEEARAEVEKMADGFDEASAWHRIGATHDAHHSLLDLLGGAATEASR